MRGLEMGDEAYEKTERTLDSDWYLLGETGEEGDSKSVNLSPDEEDNQLVAY
jgi:hypothetical protein